METYLTLTEETQRVYIGKDRQPKLKRKCICKCGKIVWVQVHSLRTNATKSCGCIKKDFPMARTHGLSNTKEYRAYHLMKNRCYNPKLEHYAGYGGRGIKMCDRWLQSFENFYEDMGDAPTSKHTLDRKENDKDYSKENCQWATWTQQANNKRNNRIHTYNGVRYSQREFAQFLGVKYNTMKATANKLNLTDEQIVERYKSK